MKWLILAFPVAVWFLLPHAANAQEQQPVCAPRVAFAGNLAEKYGEARIAAGLITSQGFIMELWGNVESGTWTLTFTRPDGVMCQMAEGQAFAHVDEAVQPIGEQM